MRIFLLLFLLAVPVFSQETLTNKDIIDLTKAGMSESLILAKMKSSKTSFDTSPAALIELKMAGVSDTVMLEMVGPKNVASSAPTVSGKSLEIKDAIELNTIYIDSEDERSQVEIANVLKKNGFTVLSTREGAELIAKFEFRTTTSEFGITPGIFGGISSRSQSERQLGKLQILIVDRQLDHLIFVKEHTTRNYPNALHRQAKSYSEDFIKELRKAKFSTTPRK
ncbi:MAG: hypothetical protein IPM25_00920 [Chloracidobacterium sp.]|nr:hypothetical protein [Chloracidobacterium sp.]